MPRIAIALSGGVDSLVAARLLKDRGDDLVGVHFRTGFEGPEPSRIHAVADQLRIPLEIADLREPFQTEVIARFVATYQAGKTPNPCLVCNPRIKFGALMAFARRFGAERLATGHYARRVSSPDGRFRLLRGADARKDQSYFLAFLTQAALKCACFPLGGMTKSDVKQFAAENGLTPVEKDESQDICFIRTGYGDFLTQTVGIPPQPGPIVDTAGKRIGEHTGLFQFTVGQRRGIGIPAKEPYYVVRLEPEANRLVVGVKSELLASKCRVSGINWIAPPPDAPFSARVQLRYRHRAAPATVYPHGAGSRTATIRFETPQSAITPGQGAVFYREDEVLGGGWIEPPD